LTLILPCVKIFDMFHHLQARMRKPSKQTLYKALFLVNFTGTSFTNNISGAATLFMTGFMLLLGAQDSDIGTLASVMTLMNVLQIFSYYVYRRLKSYKWVSAGLTILRYLIFYSKFFIAPFLSVPTSGKVLFVIICVCFESMFNALKGNGILSWNDTYIADNAKGSYYSIRNVIANVVGIICSLTIGRLLDTYGKQTFIYLIIAGVMISISVIETVSLLLVPDYRKEDEVKITLKQLLTIPVKDKKYLGFVIFSIWWNFSLLLATPYFNVYAVKTIGVSYTFIAAVGSVTMFVKVLVGRVWGKFGDKKGWKNILTFAGLGYALTNGIWMLMGPGTDYLYAVNFFFNGLCMIGVNIAIFNTNICLSDPDHRLIYLNFTAAVTGLFSFFGPRIGTAVVSAFQNVNISIFTLHLSSYQLLFMISGILQVMAVFYARYKIFGRQKCEIGPDRTKN